jgi:hypothetical protein
LYQSERFGNIQYEIPLPQATFEVILHFAEIDPATSITGQRFFDVQFEGETVFSKVDIIDLVDEPFTALALDTVATILDGALSINLIPISGLTR